MKPKALCSVLPFSLLFSISHIAEATPTRVIDLRVTNVGPGNATLTWTTPTPASGILIDNDVRYSTVPVSAINWASRVSAVGEPIPMTAGVSQSAIITGLQANTAYSFGLKVRDGTGWSLLSNVVPVTTSAAGKTATLIWVPPTENGGPQPGVRGYTVCQSKTTSYYANCVETGNVTTYTFTGLTYGSTDYFVVRTYFDNTVLQSETAGYETNPNVPNSIYSPWSNPASKD